MDSDRKVMVETTVGSAAFGDDHIYYFGAATADQAQKLGKALLANQFFQGKGVDVLLAKHKDGTAISFVVSDGVWNDSESIGEFNVLAKLIAPSVGGLPVKIRLLNSQMETKKDFVVKSRRNETFLHFARISLDHADRTKSIVSMSTSPRQP